MNLKLLQKAVEEIKIDIDYTVTTATYGGKEKSDGLEAKGALIKSGTLIQRIHEVVKIGLNYELTKRNIHHTIHPPIGSSSPELDVWGHLKKKKQDIVILTKTPSQEVIDAGPLKGDYDMLGKEATKHGIVINIRSQLSSIDKNYDTLMERAFAETSNLRLRHPSLVMGEVYLLTVKEYDEQFMKKNKIKWKNDFAKVEKFISIFNGISHRKNCESNDEFYKYERSSLILADLSTEPVNIYKSIDELKKDGIVSADYQEDYQDLSPVGFSKDIIDIFLNRHGENIQRNVISNKSS